MPNLKKLDDLIGDLEKQAEELSDFASVHSEISDIKTSIYESSNTLKSGNKELSKISNGIKNNVKNLESKVNTLLSEVESKILNKIQTIEDDNKKFYKDLDYSIASRLGKHKSDIQVEVRDEAKNTAKVIETNLKAPILEKLSKLDKKINVMIVIMIVTMMVRILFLV